MIKCRKNGNGEGTIYYSETLKKWVGQFCAGRKEDGSLNRKSVYGNTRKEVKEKMTLALADIQKNTYIDKTDITVSQLGRIIIENKFETNTIKEVTYLKHNQTFRHIKESNIADKKVQEINFTDIQNFINTKKDYANAYIDKIFEMLGSIFKEAIKREIINKNPMLNVIKPISNKEDKKIESLSVEEQKAFIIEVKKDEYKNIMLIALHSGMRVGEILALTRDDIDFENKKIKINKTLTKDRNGKPIIGKTTKTYNSNRTIPLTRILEPILRDSITNYIPNKNNLLFCHFDGQIIATATINTHFKKICKNADIKVKYTELKRVRNGKEQSIKLKTSSANEHMLRHTYATRCIEAGIPAEVLQKLLGHKNITITINTYTTIFDKFKEETLNLYENYINII